MKNIKERLEHLSQYYGLSMRKFEELCGLNRGNLSNMGPDSALGSDKLSKISDNLPEINLNWLVTGKGEMLRPAADEIHIVDKTDENKKNLIPFYEDVSSIGGVNSISATQDGNMPASEWIDAGDWFLGATAAIRHYGDSMIEYPSGCILVLKRVEDTSLLVWGRNYVIETQEFRITKQLQEDGPEYIMAYSSNRETYPDGRQIHSPIRIHRSCIRSLFLVMGCVVKEQSSGAVYIK